MKQAAFVVLVFVVLTGCYKLLAMNEASANAYRAQQVEQPLVLGHRIGPNGQEMLVVK